MKRFDEKQVKVTGTALGIGRVIAAVGTDLEREPDTVDPDLKVPK